MAESYIFVVQLVPFVNGELGYSETLLVILCNETTMSIIAQMKVTNPISYKILIDIQFGASNLGFNSV